ncbi:MAG: hypothetical protein QMC40_03025 [Vicingaceae bacterium]|jgi:hypothetical protein
MEKVSCNKCKTENSTKSTNCSNCKHELNQPSVVSTSFFTARVKFQIALAIVVFIAAFFGTKYLIEEFKKSTSDKVELDVSSKFNNSSNSITLLNL